MKYKHGSFLQQIMAFALVQMYMVPPEDGQASPSVTTNDGPPVKTAADAEAASDVAATTESIDAEVAAKRRQAEQLEKVKAAIANNTNPNIIMTEVDFHFKKDKKLGLKRPAVKLAIPQINAQGLIAAIEAGGKQLDLLLEAANEVFYAAARDQVNANEDISQDTLDLAKLDWKAISELPKSERRGGGIAAEVWEAFAEDYMTVMPAVTGKKEEIVGNAVKLLVGKFNACKSNKKVVAFLQQQLALWWANTKEKEDFAECYKFLDDKANALLAADESALLLNL